ncbi:DUF3347 domain-containing protein [Chryseolinea sp. T2]|uniref:DUF3347 domain-containing protein n=1 Tax=Chryseolinea sp. T2 TaxID=3129255 RepID=UPI003077108A
MTTINRTANKLVVALLAIVLSACGGKNAEHEHVEHAEEASATAAPAASAPQYTADEEFKKQLTAVFESYTLLKDAFVSSDAAKVMGGATATLGALDKVDMKLVDGAAHHDWMTYLESMKKSLQEIGAAGDIEGQRAAFSNLSNDLYKTIKAYGLSGETAYYEYCPMAFDNKGAYWLAKEEKIRNPYFGDKMLTCGSVQETLR